MHRLKVMAAIGFLFIGQAVMAQAPGVADDASTLSCADFNAAASQVLPDPNASEARRQRAVEAQDYIGNGMVWLHGYLTGRNGPSVGRLTREWISTNVARLGKTCAVRRPGRDAHRRPGAEAMTALRAQAVVALVLAAGWADAQRHGSRHRPPPHHWNNSGWNNNHFWNNDWHNRRDAQRAGVVAAGSRVRRSATAPTSATPTATGSPAAPGSATAAAGTTRCARDRARRTGVVAGVVAGVAAYAIVRY